MGTYATTYGFWVFMTLLTLIPIWWMFVVSMRSRVELFSRPNLAISRIFVENYSNVLTDSTFQRYMTNSVVVSTCNAAAGDGAGAAGDLRALALQAGRAGQYLSSG